MEQEVVELRGITTLTIVRVKQKLFQAYQIIEPVQKYNTLGTGLRHYSKWIKVIEHIITESLGLNAKSFYATCI